MDLPRTRAIARLLYWLGPWASDRDRPHKVLRRRISIGDRFDAWVYRPRTEPRAALLVVPGLHYLGPADPRLDRFLAILADAGTLAVCPFLPECRALRAGPEVIDDVVGAFDALCSLPEVPRDAKPAVLAISFGCYSAIHLGGLHDRVGSLILFGGYASFDDTIRFSMEGDGPRPHDPLNRPAVFLNLLPYLDGLPADPEPLRRAWITFVRRTWGRTIMKERARYEPVAREIAASLPEDARSLFLIGTGVEDGGVAHIASALERGRASLTRFDPLPACAHVRAPVTIVHGTDDDVIPYTHAQLLADAMPPDTHPRVLLTGMYTHTGHGGVDPRAAIDELRTMRAILETLADAGALHASLPSGRQQSTNR